MISQRHAMRAWPPMAADSLRRRLHANYKNRVLLGRFKSSLPFNFDVKSHTDCSHRFFSSSTARSYRYVTCCHSSIHISPTINIGIRSFSSTPEPRSGSNSNSNETVLFQRPTTRNDSILKSSIVTASLHTAYWTWYIIDFIPLVNNSGRPELYIDPALGYTGFIFAIAIQALVFVYPKRLVSKLSLVEAPSKTSNSNSNHQLPSVSSQQLFIYNYSLFVRPSTVPSKYKIGELSLDPSSPEMQQIMYEYRGNAQLFRGRIGLKAANARIPFLLDIRQDSDVVNPRLLLQALLVSDKDVSKQHQATRVTSLSGKKARRRSAPGSQHRRR